MSNPSPTLIDRPGTEEEGKKLGLLDGEFQRIEEKLGRTPTFTEVVMFSGMWSEHCSYKNSILLLKTLYSKSDRLLAAPGEENAGALRLNDRQAVVFKIESHNHPSAIEPYQGAATGVGGIMRDIFTMGARPIATLNSLRFGPPGTARNGWLLRQVVKGIGDYGNSLGIATAGGEVWFHESYTRNPLVNAMTVGIAPVEKMASAKASGIGNPVVYFGAKTGRDGIHGASFASKDLSDESAEERSAVQVGDPFMEKLLMEATLECIEKGLVVAIQDMGAAGLLSSSSEMAASGNVGIDLYLEKVPAREEAMQPFEYLLSESQERMLAVCEPEKLEEVKAVFEKWDLHAEVIGSVNDSGNLRIFQNGELYANVPASLLAKEAPRYEREVSAPAKSKPSPAPVTAMQEAVSSNKEALTTLLTKVLSHPNFASRLPLHDQYDTDIGLGRLVGPGQNAGIYRVPDSNSALAMTTDGNSFYVSLDPFKGAVHTVVEGIRNLASAGATPLGITNCLNFANPYKPENYFFFKEAIRGMSTTAEFFEIPVTGGNVSFYNESQDGPVLPTPTIGMVGLIEDASYATPASLEPGMDIYLVGDFKPTLGCGGYTYALTGDFGEEVPQVDLAAEKASMNAILQLIQDGVITSASDLAHGGLLFTLLKMTFAGTNLHPKLGIELQNRPGGEADLIYWGETAHCYLVGGKPGQGTTIQEVCQSFHVNVKLIGKANDSGLLTLPPTDNKLTVEINQLKEAWSRGLSPYFHG